MRNSIAYEIVSDVIGLAERTLSERTLIGAARLYDNLNAMRAFTPHEQRELSRRVVDISYVIRAARAGQPFRPHLIFDAEADTNMRDA